MPPKNPKFTTKIPQNPPKNSHKFPQMPPQPPSLSLPSHLHTPPRSIPLIAHFHPGSFASKSLICMLICIAPTFPYSLFSPFSPQNSVQQSGGGAKTLLFGGGVTKNRRFCPPNPPKKPQIPQKTPKKPQKTPKPPNLKGFYAPNFRAEAEEGTPKTAFFSLFFTPPKKTGGGAHAEINNE